MLGIGKSAYCSRAIATSLVPEVAIAQVSIGSEPSNDEAPAIVITPCVSAASTAAKCLASSSTRRCGATSLMVSTVLLPCATRMMLATSRPCCCAHCCQWRSMQVVESIKTPSRSNSMASHSICIIFNATHRHYTAVGTQLPLRVRWSQFQKSDRHRLRTHLHSCKCHGEMYSDLDMALLE
jgi:hypothetical protein